MFYSITDARLPCLAGTGTAKSVCLSASPLSISLVYVNGLVVGKAPGMVLLGRPIQVSSTLTSQMFGCEPLECRIVGDSGRDNNSAKNGQEW